ncbi:hypothetical protein AAFF_G00106020 [Aldrovandia affinis]|uniref:Uncharacterized protein n=1 Tax=Aldrovandia affinis TaxID=143900 RepID=A0AAD7T2J1_9TELE|nr:hypothetical protein AAFF_G00106020 [Aldrovandia affinis]
MEFGPSYSTKLPHHPSAPASQAGNRSHGARLCLCASLAPRAPTVVSGRQVGSARFIGCRSSLSGAQREKVCPLI